jgi:hypothetical protein
VRNTWASKSLVAVICALIATAPIAAAVGPSRPSALQVGGKVQAYPTSSWAIGVVVPQGAGLQGGGKVAWDGVSNVTALVTLPNITLPDGIVYAVVSLMTSGGSVVQAAAGIWPNESTWAAFSWLITGVGSPLLNYDWILNASRPVMTVGSDVTISIYLASGSWNLKITDLSTGAGVAKAFPGVLGDSLMVGDQEAFALESYTRSSATFHDMGNLTLGGLFLNGDKVTGGVYTYSVWDPDHDPLFAVGSSGTSPPSFASIGRAEDGSFVWGYDTMWNSGGDSLAAAWVTGAVVAGAILIGTGAAIWGMRRARHRPPNP